MKKVSFNSWETSLKLTSAECVAVNARARMTATVPGRFGGAIQDCDSEAIAIKLTTFQIKCIKGI
jgi:hypothetical protein